MKNNKLAKALLLIGLAGISMVGFSSCANVDNSTTNAPSDTTTSQSSKKEIKNVTFQGQSFTYDGNAHSLAVSGLPEGVSVTYTGNGQINVGTYTVTAHFSDSTGTYIVPNDMTALLIINQKTIDNISFVGESFVYDGNAHSIEATNIPEGVNVTYSIDGNSGNSMTDVGEYEVTAHFTQEGHNYVLPSDMKANLIITPKSLGGVVFNDLTTTYDGSSHSIEATNIPEGVNVSYKINGYSGNSATNAGEYEVVAHFTAINDNYTAPEDMTAVLTINKKNIAFTMTNETIEYNSGVNSIVVNEEIPSDITITYFVNGEEFYGATNAGEYVITAQINDLNNNYNVVNIPSAKLTITKATFDVSDFVFIDKTFEYDGTSKSLEGYGSYPAGIEPSYTIDGVTGNSAINAGTYEVILHFEVEDKDNYNLVPDRIRELKITKKKISIPSESSTNYVYNGNEITYDLPESTYYTVSNNKKTNAGEYVVNVSLNDVNNTIWSDNTSTDKNYDFVINKATYDISEFLSTFNNLTVAYDGNEHELKGDSTKLPDGVTVEYSNNKLTNAGSLNVTATFSHSNTNYNVINNITRTLSITKSDVPGLKFESQSYTYDGDSHNILVTGTLPATVSVNYYVNNVLFTGAINAGIYNIVAKFTDSSNNYEIDDMEATLTINKATYDISEFLSTFNNLTVTYDGNEHELKGDSTKLPTGLTVNYSNNKKTNAGNYTVIATFTNSNTNYNNVANVSRTLTINKADFEVTFNNKIVTYDGSSTSIEIEEVLPTGCSVSYTINGVSGNSATNAGSYTVIATFTMSGNYNSINSKTATLTISKKDISSLLSFSDKTFSYDGNPHTIEVVKSTGVPSTLTVTYSIAAPVKAGTYPIDANITETSGNYIYPNKLSANIIIVKDGKYWDVVFDYGNGNKIEYVIENNKAVATNDIPELDEETGYNVSWSYNGGVITADQTFTVVKTAIEYEIEYKSSISITNTNKTKYTILDSFTLVEPTPGANYDGYVFEGWYLENTYDTKISAIQQGTTGKKTLYARFIDLHVTANKDSITKDLTTYDYVAFKYDDYELLESFNVSSLLSIPTGTTAKLYSDSNLTTEITSKIMTLSIGVNISYYVVSSNGKSYTYMVLVNKHDMKAYRAYVDGNVKYSGLKEKGTTVSLPDEEKTGYTFAGWSLENDSSVTVSMPYTITTDVDFYAYFISSSYKVTYKLDDETELFYDMAAYGMHYTIHDPYVDGDNVSVKWRMDDVLYDIDYEFDYNYSKPMTFYAVMDTASSEFTSTITDGKATINSYTGTNTSITIPNYVLNGTKYYKVNAIGDEAFMNNTSLTNVVINNNIENIGIRAFYGANNINYYTYGNGYYLGNSTNNYLWLVGMDLTKTSIVIKPETNNVAFGALYNSNIESIEIPFIGKNVASEDAEGLFGYIFGDEEYTNSIAANQYYASTKSVNYYIPNTLRTIVVDNGAIIKYGSFYNISMVENITLPNDIETLGIDSLRNMTNLKSLVIPDSVNTLPNGIINGCLSLESIILPFIGGNKVVNEPGESTLFGYIFGNNRTGFDNNLYHRKQQYYSETSGGKYATIPVSLKTVTITGGEKIFYGAFYYCDSIEKIILPEDMVYVPNVYSDPKYDPALSKIFFGCTNLQDVLLPVGVNYLKEAFKNCTSLANINYCGDEKDWADISFDNKDSNPMTLSSQPKFNIKNNLGEFEEITTLDLTGVEAIGNYAFYNFKSVNNITLSLSLKTIGDYAFYNCSSVISLNLNEGLESIGKGALSNMSGLTTLVVPSTVTSMESGALAGDGAITDLTIPFVGSSINETLASKTTLFGYIFGSTSYDNSTEVTQNYDANNTVKYYVPSNLTDLHITNSNSILFYGSFSNCTMLKNITIEGNLTYINARSFANGLDLDNLYLPNTIETIAGLAFYQSRTTNLYYNGTLTDWLGITFIGNKSDNEASGANPKCFCDNFYWKEAGSYKKPSTTIVIPDGIENIGNIQFDEFDINYIFIPASLKTIGTDAFNVNNIIRIYYYGTDFSDITTNLVISPDLIYYYVTCVHYNNQFTFDSNDNIVITPNLSDEVIDTEPSCTLDGLKHRECNVCHEHLEETIDALGHDYGAWTITDNPTCTETGTREHACSRCGHVEEEEIEKLPHSYNTDGICTECGDQIEYYTVDTDDGFTFDSENKTLSVTNTEGTHEFAISINYDTHVSFDYAFDTAPTNNVFRIVLNGDTVIDTSEDGAETSGEYSIDLGTGSTLSIIFENDALDTSVITISNLKISYRS